MRHIKQRLLLVPLVILLLTVLACDAWLNIDGVVTDESNKPLADARVVIKQANQTIGEYRTDESGRFHAFESIAPFDTQLKCTITKVGYAPAELSIDGNAKRTAKNPLRIVLKRSGG